MIAKFFKKLNEPFPSSRSFKESLIEIFWVGVFVASFLYLFKPFGVSEIPQHQLLICIGFGFVTFFVGTIFNFFEYHVFKLKTDVPSWTLWKWILLVLGMLVCIAFGNLMFSMLIQPGTQFSLSSIWSALATTSMIGFFPCAASGFLIQLRASKRNQDEADTLNRVMTEEESKESASSDALAIKYVEAMQNYVELNYGASQEPASEMLRSTLQAIEEKHIGSRLVRCHRSFLVNTDFIDSVSGNAQGLKLKVLDCEKPIPVSRSYIRKIREMLTD